MAINAVRKEPFDLVTRLPMMIGAIMPPMKAPMLMTEKEEPMILLDTKRYGNTM